MHRPLLPTHTARTKQTSITHTGRCTAYVKRCTKRTDHYSQRNAYNPHEANEHHTHRSLYGICEALYEEDLGPDALCKLAARCLLAAMGRDCMSGVEAVVHLISPQGVTTHVLPCPSD